MVAIRATVVLLVVALVVAQLPGAPSDADRSAHSQQAAALQQAVGGTATFCSARNNPRAGFDRHGCCQAMPSFAMLGGEQLAALLQAAVDAHPSPAPPDGSTLFSLHCMMTT